MEYVTKKEEWLYYYALYHMLAHWSAMMTTLGLLITVGVAAAYSGVATRAMVLLPSLLIYMASLWFNYRMYVFSNFVHSRIEPEVRPLWSLPHPCANVLACAVATGLLLLNLFAV